MASRGHKVVALGARTCGKSALFRRLAHPQAPMDGRGPVICASFFRVDNLELWDTGGQERFRALPPVYFRRARAALLCYDVTAPDSLLEAFDLWLPMLEQHVPHCPVIVVGCKADRISDKAVDLDTVHAAVQRHGNKVTQLYGPVETSALARTNLDRLFAQLKLLVKEDHDEEDPVVLPPEDDPPASTCC